MGPKLKKNKIYAKVRALLDSGCLFERIKLNIESGRCQNCCALASIKSSLVS